MTIQTNEYLALSFASGSAIGDGVASTLVLANLLKDEKLIWVTIDGLDRRLTNDYTVDLPSKTITFVVIPAKGQIINIKYAIK
jgi:hypothetical protein